MIQFPVINPEIIHIAGPFGLRWYGLMYVIAFTLAIGIARIQAKKPENHFWDNDKISDLMFYVMIGMLIGGRSIYALIYNFSETMAHPLSIFYIWEGGMSFHGGFLGSLFGILYFCRRYKISFFTVTDFCTLLVPLGIMFGRIGNFVNGGELFGRITDVPWGMIFPDGGPFPRHPSQLYEAFAEGLVLFFIIFLFSSRPRPTRAKSGVFLVGYATARIICEMFRQPDIQMGFIFADRITTGQILSLPMFVYGIVLIIQSYRYEKKISNINPCAN